MTEYCRRYGLEEYHKTEEIRDWCRDTFGQIHYYNGDFTQSEAPVSIQLWYGDVLFYFKSQEVYNWFMLRWG